jgi:hypothetical protein
VKEGNQLRCWIAMEGGDSQTALVGGGQVCFPIRCWPVASRRLPTHFYAVAEAQDT